MLVETSGPQPTRRTPSGCSAGQAASFERAKLTDSSFEGCDLNNTRWRHAKLASAAFRGCKLTGANFEGWQRSGWTFPKASVGAALSGMSFRKQRLEELDFSDADLSGCDFREAVFVGGSLRNAHIPQANFGSADLRGTDLGGLKMLDAKAFPRLSSRKPKRPPFWPPSGCW